MNKFIETDIISGIKLLTCAVSNILNGLDSMEIDSFKFGPYISSSLVEKCMIDLGWKQDGDIWYSPSLRDFVFTDDVDLTIELYNGQYS